MEGDEDEDEEEEEEARLACSCNNLSWYYFVRATALLCMANHQCLQMCEESARMSSAAKEDAFP